MPQLAKVEFDFRYLPDIDSKASAELEDQYIEEGGLKPGEMQERREAADAVPLALGAIGDRLNELELIYEEDDGLPPIGFRGFAEADLASFLSSFPSLARLSLRFFQRRKPKDPAILLSILATFRHLRYLHLHAIDYFGDTSAAPSWGCPLETLSLTIGLEPSLPALPILLAHFPSTITVLHLQTGHPRFDRTVPSALSCPPLPVPHLHTLILESNDPYAFLDFFTLCPLEHVTIKDCRKISPEALEAFVTTHSETLRCFTVRALTDRPSLSYDGLQMLCKTNGIRFIWDSKEEEENSDDE